jgi:hypothetical protein
MSLIKYTPKYSLKRVRCLNITLNGVNGFRGLSELIFTPSEIIPFQVLCYHTFEGKTLQNPHFENLPSLHIGQVIPDPQTCPIFIFLTLLKEVLHPHYNP